MRTFHTFGFHWWRVVTLALADFSFEKKIFFLDVVQTLVSMSYSTPEFLCESFICVGVSEKLRHVFLAFPACRLYSIEPWWPRSLHSSPNMQTFPTRKCSHNYFLSFPSSRSCHSAYMFYFVPTSIVNKYFELTTNSELAAPSSLLLSCDILLYRLWKSGFRSEWRLWEMFQEFVVGMCWANKLKNFRVEWLITCHPKSAALIGRCTTRVDRKHKKKRS